MDHCMNCLSRGDLNKCMATACTYHELWIINEINKINVSTNTQVIKFIEELEGKWQNMATVYRKYGQGPAANAYEECAKMLEEGLKDLQKNRQGEG